MNLKKIVIVSNILLSLPYIWFIVLNSNFLLSYKSIIVYLRDNDFQVLYYAIEEIFLVPLIILSLSIIFYFVNRGHYYAWLAWTGVCIILFILGINDNPRDGLGYLMLFWLYMAGCLFLLLMAGIWKITEKERMPKQH